MSQKLEAPPGWVQSSNGGWVRWIGPPDAHGIGTHPVLWVMAGRGNWWTWKLIDAKYNVLHRDAVEGELAAMQAADTYIEANPA